MTKGLRELLCTPGFGSSADVIAATDGMEQQQGTLALLEACQRAAMAHRLHHNIIPHVRVSALYLAGVNNTHIAGLGSALHLILCKCLGLLCMEWSSIGSQQVI